MARVNFTSVRNAKDLCPETMAMWQSQANRYGTAYGIFLDGRTKTPSVEYLKAGKEYVLTILPR